MTAKLTALDRLKKFDVSRTAAGKAPIFTTPPPKAIVAPAPSKET